VHAFASGARLADVAQYALEWTLGLFPGWPPGLDARVGGARQALTAAVILYGLIGAGLWGLWRRERAAAWFGVGTLLVPVVLTGLYILGPGRFFARCVILLMPILLCLAAQGIVTLPRRFYQVAALAAILLPFHCSLVKYLRNAGYRDNHLPAHERFLKTVPGPIILCSQPFDFIPTAFYDLPRDRVGLLNSDRLSLIQRVIMGRERIIYRRAEMLDRMRRSPAPDQVLLVVSDWDFSADRAAHRARRVQEFEQRWLGGFRRVAAAVYFERSPKWVYCGLYQMAAPLTPD